MKTVYPGALEFHQDKCLGKSSSFELIIEFGKTEEALSKLTLTATELLARRDTFQKNLLQTTKRHHQVFLCEHLSGNFILFYLVTRLSLKRL